MKQFNKVASATLFAVIVAMTTPSFAIDNLDEMTPTRPADMRGALVQIKDPQNALLKACRECRINDVRSLLLVQGIDVNHADADNNRGMTPLMNVSEPIIKLLLANGADVNKVDNMGWTPLRHVCSYPYMENMPMLLALFAAPEIDVNKVDNMGYTPLDSVCDKRSFHIGIISCLLTHGADVDNALLILQNTPSFLQSRHHDEAVSLLKNRQDLLRRLPLFSIMDQDLFLEAGVLDLNNPIDLTVANEYIIATMKEYV